MDIHDLISNCDAGETTHRNNRNLPSSSEETSRPAISFTGSLPWIPLTPISGFEMTASTPLTSAFNTFDHNGKSGSGPTSKAWELVDKPPAKLRPASTTAPSSTSKGKGPIDSVRLISELGTTQVYTAAEFLKLCPSHFNATVWHKPKPCENASHDKLRYLAYPIRNQMPAHPTINMRSAAGFETAYKSRFRDTPRRNVTHIKSNTKAWPKIDGWA